MKRVAVAAVIAAPTSMRGFDGWRRVARALAASVVAMFVGLIASAAALAAPSVFVDPAGTCAGRAPCFTTIQAGVNSAAPAPAVVNVFPGTYAESVDLALMGSAVGGSTGDLVVRTVNAAGAATNGTARVLPPADSAFFTSAAFSGDMSIRGFTVQSVDSDGIAVVIQGSLELLGVVSDANASAGLAANVNLGDLHIANSSLSDSKNGTGIAVSAAHDVTLERVVADGNALQGASVGLNGHMRATQSSFSNNTTGAGLSFATATDVTFDGVTASGNFIQGTSFALTGMVVVRDSMFDANLGGNGLSFATATDVTFERITANGNAGQGASFAMTGQLRVSDSTFDDNTDGNGLSFATATDVHLENVTADRNQSQGASFATTGDVFITDSTFDHNTDGNGLSFATASNVTLQRVTATHNNDQGASFAVTSRVLITASTFDDNRNGDGLSFASARSFEGVRISAVGNAGNGISCRSAEVRITGSHFENNLRQLAIDAVRRDPAPTLAPEPRRARIAVSDRLARVAADPVRVLRISRGRAGSSLHRRCQISRDGPAAGQGRRRARAGPRRQTALARMPSAAQSRAMARVSPTAPCLAAT